LNNPLMYTDPTGEFIHLIVGAVIGGGINLWTNWKNIDGNFWKGLGYFGVGALAGGLSAGVGAGLSSSLAGGSFMAGALGTSTALTSSGLVAGGIIGTATGFTNGFILGMGNGLLGGQNIGQSLRAGLHQGATQGAYGFATGVILGGMDEIFKVEKRVADKTNKIADEFEAMGHTIDNLDMETVGKNLNNSTYMGGRNAKTYSDPLTPNRDYLGKVPKWGYREYGPYLHDVDFYKMGIGNGAAPYLTSTRTLATDWKLAGRHLYLSLKHFDFGNISYGLGMTSIATYKSLFYLWGR
jgi:hypothetical protein